MTEERESGTEDNNTPNSELRTPNSKPRILIVEDSAVQAEAIRHTLAAEGYAVTVAKDGADGLAKTKELRPELVISDILMPEMNGFELCRHIKADEDLRNTPVILLTSLSDPADVISGLECGADNFIIKPYDEKYLLSRIRYMLLSREFRKDERTQMGVEIYFADRKYFITSEKKQILDLLISTYESAVQKNFHLIKVQEELQALNEKLEEKVEERTAELVAENHRRKLKEEEIQKLNEELEYRVLERTAQLDAANNELEAFSYSVSHDLRAPLRHMTDFAELLKEHASSRLDEKSLRYLNNITDSATSMNKLIDDLLSFSRIGRSEMKKDTVDMSHLVTEVLNEFKIETKKRDIIWNIDQLPGTIGDKSLLKLVFVNLLSNALKFTRNCERAEIEIGAVPEGNEIIFFVKDNGVGFDMQYSDKLFGVFQRLHRQEDFEGTGIGLANVRRIIQRHGGRIWGEGKVNEGASFYFTLPKIGDRG